MNTTPEPLLVKKMTRIALQILSTAEPRSKVTSPAAELVLESISSASPKVRRELLDAHLAALEWILKDAFTSQVPKARFNTDTAPDTVPVSVEDAVRTVLAQNRKLREIVNLLPAELVRAWDHGYVCGASDHVDEPIDETYLNICNPYTLEKGDSTP